MLSQVAARIVATNMAALNAPCCHLEYGIQVVDCERWNHETKFLDMVDLIV